MSENLSKPKSLKFNLVVNCLRVGLDMLFPLITFPYVSRILGPVNMGKISFSSSVINYFVLLASLGIPSYGTLICAKARNDRETLKKTVCELMYISIFVTLATYILFFISLISVTKFRESMTLMLINSVSILGTAAGFEWLYSGLEDYGYITARSTLFKIISLVLILTLVKEQNDYLIYAAIVVFASVGSNIMNCLHARNLIKFYPLSELNWKRHIKPIFSLFAATLAATISANTDTLMLGFFKGDYEVGIYSFAVKIKTLLSTVMTAALRVFVPRFSYYVKAGEDALFRKQVRIIFTFTLAVAVALVFYFITFSTQTVEFLGGEQYTEALLPTILLTSNILVLAVTWTLGVGVLQPLERENLYAKGMITGCVVNVALNAVLIPLCSVSGASVATIISESVIGVLFYFYTKDFLNGCLKKTGILKMLLSALVASCASYAAATRFQVGAFWKLFIGIVIYLPIFSALLLALHPELKNNIRENLPAFLRKKIGKA